MSDSWWWETETVENWLDRGAIEWTYDPKTRDLRIFVPRTKSGEELSEWLCEIGEPYEVTA